MTAFKHIAIAGASGDSLGPLVVARLASSPQFSVTVLKREGSKSTFPPNVSVKEVDYSSPSSLASALSGIDALVSCLGTSGLEAPQLALADASIAAGVQRFLPSSYGCDLSNALGRKLPNFQAKVKVEDYLIEKAGTTGLSYTFVYNEAFLDWGLQQNFFFDSSAGKPIIYDGGDIEFSAATLASVVQAIVGVLEKPDETKNRVVRIHDLVLTQNRLLELAKKAAPGRKWEPVHVRLDDLTAAADAKLKAGDIDNGVWFAYIMRGLLDPAYGPKFEKTDNELLGIKGKTEDDVVDILKSILN
jgi:uncharacterized protein YbjT (DUF2867 family)